MQFIDKIKDRYQAWKEQRFLKKHGCETWEQYNYRFDPDRNQRATRIRDYYYGYKHWTPLESRDHTAYYWDVHLDGIYVLTEWCKENLSGKFRFDWHRVMKAPATANEWHINELGGGDYIFFACQEPEDFFLFQLKWGS